MQFVACIIYTLKCISKEYEDPGEKKSMELVCFSVQSVLLLHVIAHIRYFPDEIIHTVLSNSQCIYSFHILHISSSSICLKYNAEDRSSYLPPCPEISLKNITPLQGLPLSILFHLT